MADEALTSREAIFVKEYLIDLNAAAALRRAGSRAKATDAIAARMMARPRVKAAIRQGMASRAARLELTADRVVQELACIAFGALSDVLDWGPGWVEPKPAASLPPEVVATVASIQAHTSEGRTKIAVRLHDKISALRLLMAHLGMTTERTESPRPTQDDLGALAQAFLATGTGGQVGPSSPGVD